MTLKELMERQQQKMTERSNIRHLEHKKQETIELSMHTRLAYQFGKADANEEFKSFLLNKKTELKEENKKLDIIVGCATINGKEYDLIGVEGIKEHMRIIEVAGQIKLINELQGGMLE